MMIRYRSPATHAGHCTTGNGARVDRRINRAMARRMAMALATRMLYRSISWADAAPIPKASTRRRTRSASRARIDGGRILLSRSPRTAAQPVGNTTAAATTGPARGPRPASSTPTRRYSSAQTARSRASVGRGGMSALALLPDSGGLAAQRAEVVQLRAAHPSPANQLDRGDRGAVDRKEPLDSHPRRDLADREGLTN